MTPTGGGVEIRLRILIKESKRAAMPVQMRNPGRSLIALGVLAAMAVLGAGPVVASTVHVADDAYIKFDGPTGNFGSKALLSVHNNAVGRERHAFVRFDLSTSPPLAKTAVVVNASRLLRAYRRS